MTENTNKTCVKCNKTLPTSEFNLSKNKSVCKTCLRKKHREYLKKYNMKKKHEKLRKKAEELKQKLCVMDVIQNTQGFKENIGALQELVNFHNELKQEALKVSQKLEVVKKYFDSQKREEKEATELKPCPMSQEEKLNAAIQKEKELTQKVQEIKQKAFEANVKKIQDSRTKTCYKCKLTKSLSDFYTYLQKKDNTRKHFNQCKRCMYLAQRERYNTSPHLKKYHATYNKIRKQRLRLQANEISKVYNKLRELKLAKEI